MDKNRIAKTGEALHELALTGATWLEMATKLVAKGEQWGVGILAGIMRDLAAGSNHSECSDEFVDLVWERVIKPLKAERLPVVSLNLRAGWMAEELRETLAKVMRSADAKETEGLEAWSRAASVVFKHGTMLGACGPSAGDHLRSFVAGASLLPEGALAPMADLLWGESQNKDPRKFGRVEWWADRKRDRSRPITMDEFEAGMRELLADARNARLQVEVSINFLDHMHGRAGKGL